MLTTQHDLSAWRLLAARQQRGPCVCLHQYSTVWGAAATDTYGRCPAVHAHWPGLLLSQRHNTLWGFEATTTSSTPYHLTNTVLRLKPSCCQPKQRCPVMQGRVERLTD